jgi:hypothetical protein
MKTLSVLFGLAWVNADTGDYDPSIALFDDILRTQRHVLGNTHPQTSATATAIIRTQLLRSQESAEYEKVISELDIVEKQTKDGGNTSLETVETMLLCAVAMQHIRNRGSRAQEVFDELFSLPISLFGSERPALLTACGLAWTYLRLQKTQSAKRIFQVILSAQRKLPGEPYPATISSVESLAKGLGLDITIPMEQGKKRKATNNPHGARGVAKCVFCRRLKRAVLNLHLF